MYLTHRIETIRNEQNDQKSVYENEIKRLTEKIAKMEDLFDEKLVSLLDNDKLESQLETINGSILHAIDPEEIQRHFTLETSEEDTIQEVVLRTKLLKEHFSSQETFYCKICYNIVVNVTQCNSCEILYCKKCIEHRVQTDENCPNCKEVFSEGKVPKITKKILEAFILQCPYMCDEYVKYSGIFKHIKE